MSKEKEETRFVYVRDEELSRTGFARVEDAWPVKEELRKKYPEPEFRVRNRYRRRTGLWDVLVKRKTAVRAKTSISRTEREVGEHAYPGDR